MELAEQRGFVSWIDVDAKKKAGVFRAVPERAELPSELNENLIVELYSK
jgi:small subunit ribosomal protein S4